VNLIGVEPEIKHRENLSKPNPEENAGLVWSMVFNATINNISVIS
jgi:hypothetical protein